MTIKMNAHKKTILTIAVIIGIIVFFVKHPFLASYLPTVLMGIMVCIAGGFICFLIYTAIFGMWGGFDENDN